MILLTPVNKITPLNSSQRKYSIYFDLFDLIVRATSLLGLLRNRPGRLDGVHIFGTSIRKCNMFLGPRMAQKHQIQRKNKKNLFRYEIIEYSRSMFLECLKGTPPLLLLIQFKAVEFAGSLR